MTDRQEGRCVQAVQVEEGKPPCLGKSQFLFTESFCFSVTGSRHASLPAAEEKSARKRQKVQKAQKEMGGRVWQA